MVRKTLKAFMVTLVLIGIALSVSNFIPKVEARDTIYGTTTVITEPEELWYYMVTLGPEEMSDRWMLEGQTYCLEDHSDCVIVFEY